MPIHYNTNQTTIPLEISSFLPQDHLVFTIEKVVNTLEDCHFDAFYHAFGYPFYHPKMLVSTLLFSYLQEILSGQEIANEEYTSYSDLPQDHLVFTIEKVVNTLEDCHFDAFYHAFGYPFYHPKMLVSTLLFSYLQEILSGQEIANEEYTSYSETDPLKIKNDKGKKNIGIVRQVIENGTGIKVYVVVSSDKSLWYTISKSALDIFVK